MSSSRLCRCCGKTLTRISRGSLCLDGAAGAPGPSLHHSALFPDSGSEEEIELGCRRPRSGARAGRVFFFRGSILQAGGALGELVRQYWGPGYAPVVRLRPVRLLVWGEKVTTPAG
ncbi:hypothetical protein NDU88_001990 [Pleurodeles waltl]|uniref:Uncharacterized protein n=1 Tax=Pleurodeles waltl TaxID=8319 RepID=A0AAV7TJD4_PLEWA|nr:hypothetical protein NDU88_001990 [Pleurodeles waltl]